MKINKGIASALTAVALVTGGGVTGVAGVAPAYAASSQEEISNAVEQILIATNAERTAAGLEPLRLGPAINTVAQNWTESMANGEGAVHNPNYLSEMPSGWMGIGENIAVGYNPSTVVAAWMASEGHRNNILNLDFTHIGIGYWVDDKGQTWFTQNFGAYPIVDVPSAVTFSESNKVAHDSVTTSWEPVAGDTVSDYQVELRNEANIVIAEYSDWTDTTATFTNLDALTNYSITVTARAVDATGIVFTSQPQNFNFTTPADLAVIEPFNITETTPEEEGIIISWEEPVISNGWLHQYEVVVTDTNNDVVGQYQLYDNTLHIPGLASNTPYTVTVTATAHTSSHAASVSAQTQTRTLLSSRAEVTEVQNLVATAPDAWTVNATWETPATVIGKDLTYTVSLLKDNEIVDSVTTKNGAHTFTNLKGNTSYDVMVQAVVTSENNANTNSSYNTSTVLTPVDPVAVSISPQQIIDVTADITGTEANVVWTPTTDGSNDEGSFTGYSLIVKTSGKADLVIPVGKVSSYTVTGLEEGTPYTFVVRSHAQSFNGVNKATADSDPVTTTTPYSPSTVIVTEPLNLNATAVSNTQIDLVWDAPNQLVGILTGYKVTVKMGLVPVREITVPDANTSLEGLTPGTTYTIEVVALANSSDWQNHAASKSSIINAATPGLIIPPVDPPVIIPPVEPPVTNPEPPVVKPQPPVVKPQPPVVKPQPPVVVAPVAPAAPVAPYIRPAAPVLSPMDPSRGVDNDNGSGVPFADLMEQAPIVPDEEETVIESSPQLSKNKNEKSDKSISGNEPAKGSTNMDKSSSDSSANSDESMKANDVVESGEDNGGMSVAAIAGITAAIGGAIVGLFFLGKMLYIRFFRS